MSSTEERLRSLQDVAVPPAPSTVALWRRVRRRRARRAASGGALAILLAALAVAFWPDTTDRVPVETVDEPPDAPVVDPEPSPPPTEVEAPQLAPGEGDLAGQLVSEFVRLLASGDLEGAATRWTGYPSGSDEDLAGKLTQLERLRADRPWLASGSVGELLVTPSFGFTAAYPVVTVVSDGEDGEPREAAAFLVAPSTALGGDDTLRIQRIPDPPPEMGPAPGTAVSPGEVIVFPGTPVEGGATAHIGGDAVRVEVDHEVFATRVPVPAGVGDEVVLTLSVATPELPAVHAFWYPLQPDLPAAADPACEGRPDVPADFDGDGAPDWLVVVPGQEPPYGAAIRICSAIGAVAELEAGQLEASSVVDGHAEVL